jgi:hypothetical protein
MYKDRDRQREANREHARAYRSRKKGMTPGMTNTEGMTEGMTQEVVSGVRREFLSAVDRFVEKASSGRPLVAHSPTCRCLMCRPQ